jgi:hypothetical protein
VFVLVANKILREYLLQKLDIQPLFLLDISHISINIFTKEDKIHQRVMMNLPLSSVTTDLCQHYKRFRSSAVSVIMHKIQTDGQFVD